MRAATQRASSGSPEPASRRWRGCSACARASPSTTRPSGWSTTCSTGSRISKRPCATDGQEGKHGPEPPDAEIAGSTARRADQGAPLGHTEVDVEHLLLALLDQAEGIVPQLLSQAGVDRLRRRHWRPSWPGAPRSAAGHEPGADDGVHAAAGPPSTPPSRSGAGSRTSTSRLTLIVAMLAEGSATAGRPPADPGGPDPGRLPAGAHKDPRQPAGHLGHARGGL